MKEKKGVWLIRASLSPQHFVRAKLKNTRQPYQNDYKSWLLPSLKETTTHHCSLRSVSKQEQQEPCTRNRLWEECLWASILSLGNARQGMLPWRRGYRGRRTQGSDVAWIAGCASECVILIILSSIDHDKFWFLMCLISQHYSIILCKWERFPWKSSESRSRFLARYPSQNCFDKRLISEVN